MLLPKRLESVGSNAAVNHGAFRLFDFAGQLRAANVRSRKVLLGCSDFAGESIYFAAELVQLADDRRGQTRLHARYR